MVFETDKQLVEFVTLKKLAGWQTKLLDKYREQIRIHSKGKLFYKIDTLFPNEHPNSKYHRLLSFEPITQGSYMKGVSNIMRIFQNSSYTAEASEKTMQEITTTKYEDKNLFLYFLELWVNAALVEDPNSLIVVYPPEFVKDKPFNQILTVPSENLVFWDKDTYIFLSEEESDVEYDFQTESMQRLEFMDLDMRLPNFVERKDRLMFGKVRTTFKRKVYHAFIDDQFFVVRETEKGGTYDIEEWDMGKNVKPPCVFAGGFKAERGLYSSFLGAFCSFGNLALLQHSQHTAVNFTFSFPRMSELEQPCDNPQCIQGFVDVDITEGNPSGKVECPRCHGTKYAAVQSPYKVYKKRFDPSGLTESGIGLAEVDDVKFYTPDTAILMYSKQEWRDYLDMAEKAIYIKQKVMTGNVESADKVEADNEELYTFLQKVKTIFYDRLRFVIQCEENYWNANPAQVTVNAPYSLQIFTEEEAFTTLNIILGSNAPDIIKANQLENFILKFVSQSSPIAKAYQVLKNVDALLLKSDLQISVLKSNQVVSVEQWILHTYAYMTLMQMYTEDSNLFMEDVRTIGEALKKRVMETYPPVPSELKANLTGQFLKD